MKIKQEIIEATYSIEELTKQEYDLLKEGLRSILADEFRRTPETTKKVEEVDRLLDLME